MRPRFVAAFLLLAVQLFSWAVPACAASSTLAMAMILGINLGLKKGSYIINKTET